MDERGAACTPDQLRDPRVGHAGIGQPFPGPARPRRVEKPLNVKPLIFPKNGEMRCGVTRSQACRGVPGP